MLNYFVWYQAKYIIIYSPPPFLSFCMKLTTVKKLNLDICYLKISLEFLGRPVLKFFSIRIVTFQVTWKWRLIFPQSKKSSSVFPTGLSLFPQPPEERKVRENERKLLPMLSGFKNSQMSIWRWFDGFPDSSNSTASINCDKVWVG